MRFMPERALARSIARMPVGLVRPLPGRSGPTGPQARPANGPSALANEAQAGGARVQIDSSPSRLEVPTPSPPARPVQYGTDFRFASSPDFSYQRDPGRPTPAPTTLALGGGHRDQPDRCGRAVDGRRSWSVRAAPPTSFAEHGPDRVGGAEPGVEVICLARSQAQIGDPWPPAQRVRRRGGQEPVGRAGPPPAARRCSPSVAIGSGTAEASGRAKAAEIRAAGPSGVSPRSHPAGFGAPALRVAARASPVPGRTQVEDGVLGRLLDEADAARWPRRPHGARRPRDDVDPREDHCAALHAGSGNALLVVSASNSNGRTSMLGRRCCLYGRSSSQHGCRIGK